MFHDWDEVLRRERDVIHSEKHEAQQMREINRNSVAVNKKSNIDSNIDSNLEKTRNIYEENGLKVIKNEGKSIHNYFQIYWNKYTKTYCSICRISFFLYSYSKLEYNRV